MLQVDLVRRHCFPVYWNGDNRRVLRGHWFARKGGLDWLPFPETVSEQLEVAYRNKVRYLLWNTFSVMILVCLELEAIDAFSVSYVFGFKVHKSTKEDF